MRAPKSLDTARVRWARSVRLVPAGREPLEPLERMSDPGELETVLAFRSLTDPAARDLAGRLVRVPQEDRLHGEGSSDAMTPFLYFSSLGSRFSDGTFGVYYAARERETAIAETVFHQSRFLAATREASREVEMQSLVASIDASVHDLRNLGSERPELLDPDPECYPTTAALARSLRDAGSNGIAYDSVRRVGGQCVALFRPRLVGPVRRDVKIRYVWDGERQAIVAAFEITPIPL